MTSVEGPRVPAETRFKVLTSLSGYQLAWLRNDVSAGLAIAQSGCRQRPVSTPASRRLIVGPDAATMTALAGVMAAVLSSIPAEGVDRVAVAALLALVVGGLCLVARLLQLGVLANFLSQPILTGSFAGSGPSAASSLPMPSSRWPGRAAPRLAQRQARLWLRQ
jgi:MFS superfamily sulfate permease-like transporter